MVDEEIREADGKLVKSVARALKLLEVMAEEAAPLTLTELRAKTGLSAATVHRLLRTLAHYDFVQQDKHMGEYRLGSKVLEMGSAVLSSLDVRTVARPVLEELVERSRETANLAVYKGREVVYIDQVESHRMVMQIFARVGSHGPVHCTGAGKALLAYQSEKEIEAVLQEGLPAFTANTITQPDLLRRELRKIRLAGVSIDMEELEEGVRCVSAPVRDFTGNVVASLSLSGPSNRYTAEYIKETLVPIAKKASYKISARMGYKY